MADIEKVIKGLECCCCHIVGMGCGNCPYEIEQKEEGIDECTTVLAYDALELLKKQEPMKPRSVSRHGTYPQIQHYCSACNAFLPRHKQEFCSVCGQAVKWEG